MIKLNGVCKTYGTGRSAIHALRDVDLEIGTGEAVAILGRSGAGKSTLLHILGCLDSFDSGAYYVDGHNVKEWKEKQLAKFRNEKVGFVMQDFALVANRSALFNVMLPMFFDKTPRKEMKRLAMGALEMVGSEDKADKRVNTLSGGEKQRIAIARAMVKQPAILLADEPTGALDTQTGMEIMEMLMQMNRSGATLVVITHDEQVAGYFQRKVILDDGKIVG